MATADGTLAIDTTNCVSAPASLRATAYPLDAGAPGNAANVTLRKHFPMPAAHPTVAYNFSAFVSQYDQTYSANSVIGALQIGDRADDLYELQLDAQLASAGQLTVILAEYAGFSDGGSSYVGPPVTTKFPVGTWTNVGIELTASQPPIASVYFNT
jgi:hypothetical protein